MIQQYQLYNSSDTVSIDDKSLSKDDVHRQDQERQSLLLHSDLQPYLDADHKFIESLITYNSERLASKQHHHHRHHDNDAANGNSTNAKNHANDMSPSYSLSPHEHTSYNNRLEHLQHAHTLLIL